MTRLRSDTIARDGVMVQLHHWHPDGAMGVITRWNDGAMASV